MSHGMLSRLLLRAGPELQRRSSKPASRAAADEGASARVPTEGERWVEQALGELRAARFTPRAWIAFLAASLVQAGRSRRDRRREHRTVVLMAVAGLAAWAAVAAAGRPGLAAVGAAWWLVVLLLLDWHLGMLERPDGRRLSGLGVANVLTLIRAAVVPVLPALPPASLGALLVAAGATDVADGYLARRRDECTRLGVWLDGVTDGFVLTVAAVAAARHDRVSPWAAVLVGTRYVLPWVVVAAAYFVHATAPSRHGYVSGRIPGVVLFAGVSGAAFGVPGGEVLVVAGAIGGLATFTATVVRSVRSRG